VVRLFHGEVPAGRAPWKVRTLKRVARIRRSRSAKVVWRVTLALTLPLAAVLALVVRPQNSNASTPTTISAGAYIIDMGAPQTVATGLKPYGMVYDLIVNQKIPVTWTINDAKVKDGIDFTFNGKDYRGGPFIIPQEYAAAAAATVAKWRALGVIVDGPTAAGLTAPVFGVLTSWPRVVLDTGKGSLAEPYYANAGIPTTSYRFALPSALTACDDLYVMPHADPAWGTHANMRNFNNGGGFIWAACHAVSVLENLDDPADVGTAPDLNFLSTTGLVPFGSHADGTPPYSYTATGSDPIMQFLGVLDSAQQNGSEQIYLPALGGAWRPTTNVLGFDPTQANVPANSPGPAASLVYGRGYGTPSNGLVMYEAGHSLENGTIPERVAAERAFFNLHLMAGLERSPKATATVASDIGTGATVPISASVTGGTAAYTYQWTSSCGGTFASSTAAATNFTAPTVSVATPCILRVTVTDSCGRITFAAAPTTVQPAADLRIAKTDSPDPVQAGTTLTYTLAVANDGPSTANAVSVSDTLPSGVTFLTATGTGWTCAQTAGVVTCTRPTLAVGAAPPITITVRPTGGGTITNTATVGSATLDPNTVNNTAKEPTGVTAVADLELIKTVVPTTPSRNGNVTFTLTLVNRGPDAATGVQVRDQLPAGLTFVSSNTGQGLYNAATGVWTIGAVPVNGTVTLGITATVTSLSAITNTAQVSAADQIDGDSTPNNGVATEDDQSSVTIRVPSADLSVTKAASTAAPALGTNVTFTVAVTNAGPDGATGIQLRDQLPAGLTFVIATASQGTYDALTGIWTVGSLGTTTPANRATLSIVARVDQLGVLPNSAQVSAADQADPDSTPNNGVAAEDDQATVSVQAPSADLSLSKAVSNPTPTLNGVITFTLTLRNAGPDAAPGVVVSDPLPAGLTFLSAVPAAGTTYDAATGNWTVGLVPSGQSRTLTIDAGVTTLVPITNTAQVSAAGITDPDSAPGNGIATEDDQASVTISVPAADLSLTKTGGPASPKLGDTVTFIVTLTNDGPNTATGVVVSDKLPPGLTFVAATPAAGTTYDAGTGVWNVGTLAPGSVTLTITATAEAIGSVTNTAQVAASDQADPDSTPNNGVAGEDDQASVQIAIQPRVADLSLTKATSTTSPSLGAVVTFTLTLTNAGPDGATGVTVADPLPAGLAFVSANPSRGTYDAVSGVWTVGTVATAPANIETLEIRARVTSLAVLTNSAQVATADQPDPDSTPGNGNAAEDDQSSVTIRVPSADLSLQKTASATAPTLGSNVTFAVTLRNAGPDTATGVVVSDPLPAGLTFVSATPSQGSYVAASGLWNVGSLATAGQATIQIVARVDSVAALTNTAQVAASDQVDPDSIPGNSVPGDDDQSSVRLQVPAADLSVTKTASNATPRQGQPFSYTVTVANAGPGPATGVTVSDALEAGLSFQSATPSQGTYNPLTGAWTVGSVGVGQTATLTITVIPTALGPIVNTAQVASSDQSDPDSVPGNGVASEDDQASLPITVGPKLADLSVAKSVSTSVPTLGGRVTFTVDATNSGPDDATGVTVVDRLPVGLTFVSASSPAYAEGTGVWAIGSIPAGQTRTLTIDARVDSTDPITNVAQVATADQRDPDSTPGNSDVTEDDQAQTTFKVPVADLSLAKRASTTTPVLGSTFTYTLDLTNGDFGPATGATVRDQLPAGLQYVSHTTLTGTFDSATGLWDVGAVASDATVSLTITVRVTQLGPIVNTAQVATSDQLDLDSTPGNGVATEDDQSAVTIRAPEADLALTKAVDNPSPRRGDTVSFTITLINVGPDGATGVQVTDQLPAGLTFVSATPSQGSYAQATGLWTVGTVPSGGSFTLVVRALVDTFSPITNTAQVTASDQPDPDSSPGNGVATEDDQTSVTLGVPNADLSVTKTASTATPAIGSNVGFRITVRNDGPADATGVVVTDALPAGLTLISTGQSQGIYVALNSRWTVGDLPVGSSATLTVTARVDALGPITNTAEIVAADQQDRDSTPGNGVAAEDDQASVTIRAPEADLSVSKTVSNASPARGENVTFTVTATNSGPDTATGVALSDALPAGLTFVSATPSQGSYDATTGIWSVGAIPSGQSRTLAIVATVTSLTGLSNTAQVSASDLPDPDSTPGNGNAAEDDQASVPLRVPSADLSLTKTVSATNPALGSTVVFTITVANAGPDDATGVTVTDLLPAGLTLVNFVPGNLVYDAVTGVWDVGTVPAGGSQQIRIRASVDDLTPKINTARVTAANQADPDSTPGNNVATEDDQASVRLAAQNADLSLTKTVSSGTPVLGANVTFTLTVSNAGPDAATGVVVSDPLPAGLVFVSSTPSQGAYDAATGLWAVGVIPVGASRTLDVVAMVNAIEAISNVAQVAASDLPDPDSQPANGNAAEDDQASAALRAPSADLSLTKAVDDSSPTIGQVVTFTIALQNTGPDTAPAVTVGDPLPAGLTFVSAAPSVGAYQDGAWTVGDVAVGTAPTLQIKARVTVLTAVANIAQVAAAGVPDPDSIPGNNVTTEDDQARVLLRVPSADLSVTKVVSSSAPAFGSNVTFTVKVTNAGPDDATNVRLLDQLPAGLVFVSAAEGQGSYAPASGTWIVGSVPAGATATLQIVARVASLGALANTAEVSAADQADPDSQPGNRAVAEDDLATATLRAPEADLSLTKTTSNAAPRLGEPFTFTLTLANAGPDAASGVRVADVLPVGLELTGTAPAGYDPATGVWAIASLASGARTTLTLSARATAIGRHTNSAQVAASDQADPDSTPGNGVVGEDDQAAAAINVGPQIADLSLTKVASVATVRQGDEFNYTLALTNAGPDAATDARVADPVPAGLQFVSSTPGGGSTYDNTTGVWAVPSLASGSTVTLQVRVRVTGTGDISNTAQVAASDQLDPDSTPANGVAAEDDQAAAAIHIPTADLSLAKATGNPAPRVGQVFDFTLSLANAGPDAATNVRVRDILPVGVELAGSAPAAYDTVTGIWSVAALASGSNTTLTLPVRATALGPITNAAQVESMDQADPDSTPGNGVVGEDDQASVGINVGSQLADLSLTKVPSSTTPSRGSTMTFTIVVSNAGPDAATGVEVAEPLPVGLDFVGAAPGTGTYSQASRIWAIPSIPSGGTATLVLSARVTGLGDLTNTAQIAASNQLDPDSMPGNGSPAEDDQASAAIHVPTADLSVTKVTSDPAPRVGNDFTFSIVVRNDGPDIATGVVLGDVLPTPLTLTSATPDQGLYSSLTGVWSVGSIAPGGSATLTLTVQVPATVDLATIGSIANTAQVTGVDQADPDSTPANSDTGEDDQASALVFPGPQIADLSLTKRVDNPSAARGSTVEFTIIATNAGPDAATGVEVGDALPAGLAFLSAAASQGTYNPATQVWRLVDPLPSGDTATLRMTARVDGTGRLENIAQVLSVGQFDPDSSPANDVAAEDDQGVAVINVPTADLSLAKSTSNPIPRLGQSFDYTLTLANAGPDPATNVQVRDILPAGITLVGAPPAGYDPATGIWDVPSPVASGATATLTVTVRATVLGSISNAAQVTASDQADPDSTPGNGIVGEDDQIAVGVNVGPQLADLHLTKGPVTATVNQGGEATFTLTLTNDGPDSATGVSVADPLPAGLAFVAADPSASYTAATGLWSVGSLGSGASATLTVTARVVGTGDLVNIAQVAASDQLDPDSSPANGATGEDDQAQATVHVPTADLSLAKATSNPAPRLGEAFDYTLLLTNAGPDAATGVEVRDALPAGIALVGAPPAAYDPATGIWTAPTPLPSGAAASLTLSVRSTVLGPLLNSAQVAASDQADPDSTPGNGVVGEDDQAGVGVNVGPQLADLSLTKGPASSTVSRNGLVTFTVTVTNDGPDTATGLLVADPLPAGLVFVSATPAAAYDGATGVWTVGSLAQTAGATLDITARVTGTGDLVNVAQVAASDQLDPDSSPANGLAGEDDQAQAAVHVPTADLSLAKAVSNPAPRLGEPFEYTLTLSNAGPDGASGVQVRDVLPAGVELVGAPPLGYDPGTGVWSVLLLDPGASISLTLPVRATALDPISNTAEVIASDQADPDSTPGNAAVAEDDQASVTIGVPVADLSVTKTVDNPSPRLGQNVTFTVTLSNAGPGAATNVAVQDQLPAGLTFVGASPSVGTFAGGPGVWTVPVIAAGQTATVRITATVSALGATANVAQVTASDQADPDSQPGNNVPAEDDQATAALVGGPELADLTLTKTTSATSAQVGDEIGYTLTLRNDGPDAATGVQVADPLPAALAFVSAAPSVGVFDPTSAIWSVPRLANGETATMTLRVRLIGPGDVTNVAQVVASDQTDPDSLPGNGAAAEDDQGQARLQVEIAGVTQPPAALPARLRVVKRGPRNIRAGGSIVYTIRVTNIGSVTAQGVVVRDVLPSGIAFTRRPSGVTFRGGGLTWEIPSLAPGASRVLRVRTVVAITARGTRRNTASAVAANAATARGRAATRIRAVARPPGPVVTG
jgi:large repetitive protein